MHDYVYFFLYIVAKAEFKPKQHSFVTQNTDVRMEKRQRQLTKGQNEKKKTEKEQEKKQNTFVCIRK